MIQVVYLPMNLKRGPADGSNPSPVAAPTKCVPLYISERTRALEQLFVSSKFMKTGGVGSVCGANDKEWKKALLPLLVDKKEALQVTGGQPWCSTNCLNEDSSDYKLFDSSRFVLSSCPHHSHHLLCIITALLYDDYAYTLCPIGDSDQCRGKQDAAGRYGEAKYWAPDDYQNFAKAFFRNDKLVDTFIKPEFRRKVKSEGCLQ